MKLFLPVLLAGLLVPPTLVHAKNEATQVDIIVQNESGDPVAQASVIVKTLKGRKRRRLEKYFN